MRLQRSTNSSGFTLMELLVVLGMASVLSLTVLTEFLSTSRRGYDHQLIARTNEQTRTLLDYIAYDLRMVGAGIPLGQSGFDILDPSLGDAPLPILTTSTADMIVMRANEKGVDTVLTAEFDPSTGVRVFSVFDASDLSIGDTVYLSDMTTGGSSGLMGVVASVAGSSVTLENNVFAGVNAKFRAGASVNRVTTITYENTADGVERDGVGGKHLLQFGGAFQATYLDAAGNPLTLPLTATAIKNNLTSIRLDVTVSPQRKTTTAQEVVVSAQQIVTLRNLILMR